ncbi:hypothetical protein CRYPA_612 [uncultured Candidatus Thioglobus sp.]|nr:hypothetical protein CRYPA_612 [uncultured Candidatus Thioglobus sp.]
MNFKSMTKQQLKDHGETIGVQLNLKNKKDELIAQLNEAGEQKADQSVAPVPTQQVASSTESATPSQSDFDIKKYLWPIVIVLVLLIWLV